MALILGTPSNDRFIGTPEDDVIRGFGGDDRFEGGQGRDTLEGGDGADTFVWLRAQTTGVFTFDGGAGRDTVDYSEWNPSAFFFYTPLVFSLLAPGVIQGVASFYQRGGPYTEVQQIAFTGVERLVTNQYAVVRLGDLTTAIEVVGGAYQDEITTGSGDDVIFGGGLDDRIDGGAGVDTAVYAGLRGAYGSVSQTRVAGGPEGGADTLSNIEVLRFLDGELSYVGGAAVWTTDEATVAVARLYDSVFDRLPDVAGLAHYRAAVDQGVGLSQMAAYMVESPEFIGRYGALNNEAFVRQVYRFVLDRDVDGAGLAAYVAALNGGLARSELIVILSESPEHRNLYQPVWETQVRALQTPPSAAAEMAFASLFDTAFDAEGVGQATHEYPAWAFESPAWEGFNDPQPAHDHWLV